MNDVLERQLQAFLALRENGDFHYPWVHVHDGKLHTTRLVIGGLVHGDEVGSLPAMLRVIDGLKSGLLRFGGKVVLFLGNPEAARQGRRFIDHDLNRLFTDAEEPRDTGHEQSRAKELMPLLQGCDLMIDLHQTSLPPRTPFWIQDFSIPAWRWTRALGISNRFVTSWPDSGSECTSPLGTTDEYVTQRGGLGLTLELGQQGFHADAETWAYSAMCRAMHLLDAEHRGASTFKDALPQARTKIYCVSHRQAYTDPSIALRPGLVNFQAVHAGELLTKTSSAPVYAPKDGLLLFPAYPKQGLKRSKYLFWLLRVLNAQEIESLEATQTS